MAENPVGTVTTVMCDTTDLDASVAFWTAALSLEVVYRGGNHVYLSALSVGGPHLAFQRVAEPKEGKNRLHLDVRVPNRAEFAARVEAMGGRVVAEHQEGDFPPWTTLADPLGNEFCIYEAHEA